MTKLFNIIIIGFEKNMTSFLNKNPIWLIRDQFNWLTLAENHHTLKSHHWNLNSHYLTTYQVINLLKYININFNCSSLYQRFNEVWNVCIIIIENEFENEGQVDLKWIRSDSSVCKKRSWNTKEMSDPFIKKEYEPRR